MSWDVPDDYDEAIAWFRDRIPMTDEEFDTLEKGVQDQAFTVADVTQLDVVTDVWNAIEDALKNGTGLDDFKAAVGDSLTAQWGATDDAAAPRIETIFRTNVQTAYAAGRHGQMTDPDVQSVRPYWMFDAVDDSRTTEICSTCDGVVLAADDSWWDGHYPPCHFNCRSVVTTLTEKQAEARGITASPPAIRADDGFGISPGAPAAEWEPSKDDYPAPLWDAYEDDES